MQNKGRQKHFSLMVAIMLVLSIVTQAVDPLTIYAESEKSDVTISKIQGVSELTVGEAIARNNDGNRETVKGYIIGYVDSEKDVLKEDFVNDANFAIADDPNETEIENILFVEISQEFQNEYGLKSNSENLGKEIVLAGSLEEIFEHYGLANLTEINLSDNIDIGSEDIKEDIEDNEEKLNVSEDDFLSEISDESSKEESLEEIDDYLKNEEDSYELSIMHMNDTHSRVENYPKIISAIKDYRREYQDSLLFHAGDVFSGTLYFNEFNGRADMALMNLMGIDAMVFGNHEFDLGKVEDGHESLSKFVDMANFPFLGTNIDFSKDPFMKDLESNNWNALNPNAGEIYNSIITEVDGEEIGIFGLTTEDTVDIASPMNVTFSNFVKTAEKAVKEFEDAGINKIVAITHLGYDSAPRVGNDLRLAREVEGIDIIVGGHSHTELSEPVVIDKNNNDEDKTPTVIVQTGEYAKNLGTLNVKFNDDGEIIGHVGRLIDVEEYTEDEEALEVLAPYKRQVDKVNNEEIGVKAKKDLLNPRLGEDSNISVRGNETELGNLITDAMLIKAREKYPETVIAFQNGGGIRAPIMKGPITVGEIISVLPFGNDPVIASLTGQEIKDILEHSVRQAPGENGGFLHVSGMKFYYDSTKEVGDRIVKMYVLEDGKEIEIDLKEEYLITTNGFTGQGGDGFETFSQAYKEGRVKDIGEIDWQQLRDYLIEIKDENDEVDSQIEGRITDLKGEGLPDPDPIDPDPIDPDPIDPVDPGKDDEGGSGKPGSSEKPGGSEKPKPDHSEKPGGSLPATGMGGNNYLIGGLVLLMVGIILFFARKKGITKD